MFDTSNYELDRPLLKEKNKKVLGLMKDELGGKIIIKFEWLRHKTYSYLMDEVSEDKKAKVTKKRVIKKLKFENYKKSLAQLSYYCLKYRYYFCQKSVIFCKKCWYQQN